MHSLSLWSRAGLWGEILALKNLFGDRILEPSETNISSGAMASHAHLGHRAFGATAKPSPIP
jgi:hypothetical protein